MVAFRGSHLAIASAFLLLGTSCKSDDLEGMQAEVSESNIKLDLPAVPDFVIPEVNPDGSHSVAEMRLNGKTYLDTEVQVKGIVLWIYDCAATVRTPEMTDKELKKLLETEPERCLRPHFVLGDSADSKVERGVEVVEYPRALRKDDKNLPDELVAEMKAALEALPPFKVGDEVVVTGTWAFASPGGFQNSNGLLTYKSMVNLTEAPTE